MLTLRLQYYNRFSLDCLREHRIYYIINYELYQVYISLYL